jgi:hypothetical protein
LRPLRGYLERLEPVEDLHVDGYLRLVSLGQVLIADLYNKRAESAYVFGTP